MSVKVRVVRAAGLIIYRQRVVCGEPEFLLLQTSYGSHHWTPPKGHVDPGESDETTAARETMEEAGLAPDDYLIDGKFSMTLNYQVQSQEREQLVPKEVVYFLAKLLNYDHVIKLSTEHQDFKWLPVCEAKTLTGFTQMANTLASAHAHILSNTSS